MGFKVNFCDKFAFKLSMLLGHCVAMGGCHGVSCDIVAYDVINNGSPP